jgi:hypothetical protein
MAVQPRYDTFEPSPLFADGSSARPLPPGTVARGQLRDDALLYEGRAAGAAPDQLVGLVAGPALGGLRLDLSDEFPFAVTGAVLDRGRERFRIYCAHCHGALGYGDGKIVERGYARPPSYHTDRLRAAPVGHFFEVITNGYGAMPDHRAEVPVADRWAIIAHIRVLQLSQNIPLADLTDDERRKVREGGKRP